MKLKWVILAISVMFTPSLFAQPSIQYNHGDPTDLEQYMLELINRARANPEQEGIFLDTLDTWYTQNARQRKPEFFTHLRQEFASYPVAQPVAFNPQLIRATRLHSQDMLNRGFSGHNTPEGLSPTDRAKAQGYPTSVAENIFYGGASNADEIINYHVGFMIDHDNLMHDTRPFGHRLNILSVYHNELGIGNVVIGQSGRITQNFGKARNRIFILGVIYDDKNGNHFYDQGEGLSGVTVMPTEGQYFAVTSASGGYAIPFDISETYDAGVAPTVLPTNSTWEAVKPVADEFEKNYQSNPANQNQMSFSITASGGEFDIPITKTLSIVKPILVKYQINQTDNVYWPREFTLGHNVKLDFNTQAPVAQFTASPERGKAPLLVHFNATDSFHQNGSIINYQWVFGDGTEFNEVNGLIDHTFVTTGVYKVSMTVTDNRGNRNSSERTIIVNDPAQASQVESQPQVSDSSNTTDSSAGGCALGNPNAAFDPLFPFLLIMSLWYLYRRRSSVIK